MPAAVSTLPFALPSPGSANEFLSPAPGADGFVLTERGRRRLFGRRRRAFAALHPGLARLKREHPEVKLDPNRVGSKQVQALILLAHHPKIWFSRDDIAAFLASIGQPSRDAIQAVNKAPQRGIAIERRGARDQTLYRLPARPAFDPGRLRVPATTSDRNGLEREARRVQKMVIEAYSAPVETWEEGHLSPDDRSGPVALQPPAVNRPYRDRFKFDRDGIRLAPAIGELTAKLGTYYTDGEQSELLEALIAARAGRQDGLDELVAMLVIRFGEEALAEALTRGA